MPLTPEEQAATNKLLADTMLVRLNEQRDSIQRLETKGTFLIGFLVVGLQIYVTHSEATRGWRISAFVFYALAAFFGVMVVRPYEHFFPPPPAQFVLRGRQTSAAALDIYLAAARVLAFEENVKVAKSKKRFWWRMLFSLAVAAACSVCSLAL